MKPWIVWMCFGLLYLGVQEAEARRITGGKPMAPRSPTLVMSNFSSIEHNLVLVIKAVTMIKHTKLRFVGVVR